LPCKQEGDKGKPPGEMAGSEQKIMIEQIGLLRRESNEDDAPSK
jgi:hypothetical protein